MSVPMRAEALALLHRPNFAHLATLRADGSPKLDPIWLDVVDEQTVVMGTNRTSPKATNIRLDQRVAISVVDVDNPYEEVQLRGIATVVPDADMAIMDRISHKYIGRPFPWRDAPENRVALRVDVTHCRYALLPFEHDPPRR